MSRILSVVVLSIVLFLFYTSVAYAQSAIKVACIGNSITEGYGLETTYPQALQQLLGAQYEVRNFGVSGRTLLKKGDYPYWNEAKYQEALAWNPDIVVIKLGTNDSKPQNWQYSKDFVKDYVQLVKSFKKLPSKPKVYISYPIPVFEDKWGITEEVVKNEILPAIRKVARRTRVETIDLYTPFVGKAALTYDGVHPTKEGAALLASEIYKALQSAKTVSIR
ncbi:GDSL-type esterase/lipase family protein [Cesiribacter sp. SM1]|uniref:GDSL-type esterase/lipase family protein n=1 Tax=Cesiribacter sp. SM1 TaxID=2861196 RepID=UPI001CD4D369|nr:GDSL-type esterase/lipase family protein [Cesiribacter sp. SM1]